MADAVKLFQTLREFLKTIGIHPLQLSHGLYNLRNVTVLVFMVLNALSSGAFFIYGAENIRDYGVSFYACTSELASVGCLLSFRSNMTTIFKLMDELEAFIEKSELKPSIFILVSYSYEPN